LVMNPIDMIIDNLKTTAGSVVILA